MQYRIVDKNGQFQDIPVKISRDESHQEIYVHGATGGFLGNYHYRIDFYKDDVPPFEYIERSGKIEGKNPEEDGVERKIQVSVYLPIAFTKELRNWLDKNIQIYESEYGEIKLGSDTEQPEKEQSYGNCNTTKGKSSIRTYLYTPSLYFYI